MNLFLIGWVVTGILGYSGTFAYLHEKFPKIADEYYRENMSHSVLIGLLGYVGFVVTFFETGFCKHGFKFK